MKRNIPNILTVIRMCLIPIVVWMFCYARFDAAAAVFLIACATDMLDGAIARQFHLITDFGKLMDPVADKGMQLTVLVSLALCGRIPYAAVLVILLKEILMFVGGIFLYRKNIVVSANWYGKAATVMIAICVLAVLLFYDYMSPGILLLAQWLPVFAAVGAFSLYVIEFVRIVRENNLL